MLTDEQLTAIRKRAEIAYAARPYWGDSWRYSGDVATAVAACVVSVSDDVPSLLAEVDRLRAELDQANAKLTEAIGLLNTVWNGVVNAPTRERINMLLRTTPAAPVPAPADEQGGPHPAVGFGPRNIHCNNCGDLRGGPLGHDSSECRYRHGMLAFEVAELLPEDQRSAFWGQCVDRYLESQGVAVTAPAAVLPPLPARTRTTVAEEFECQRTGTCCSGCIADIGECCKHTTPAAAEADDHDQQTGTTPAVDMPAGDGAA